MNGSVTAADDWFVPLSDPAVSTTHVYAFPHTGGGATAFFGLAQHLAPETCLWALNLPGREARFLEPVATALDPLLDTLAAELAGRQPPAFLGYCSGALVAFLLARRMRRLGLPLPCAIVAVSYPSPDRARPPRGLHELDEEQFWREILSYGGVPAAVAGQPDFREIFGPVLRGDHALLAGYECAPEDALATPITLIHGADDPVLHRADIDGWRAHTDGGFDVTTIPGGHWLLDGDPRELAGAVAEAVRRGAGTPVLRAGPTGLPHASAPGT